MEARSVAVRGLTVPGGCAAEAAAQGWGPTACAAACRDRAGGRRAQRHRGGQVGPGDRLVRQAEDPLERRSQGRRNRRVLRGQAHGAPVGQPGLDQRHGERRLELGGGPGHRDHESVGRRLPDGQAGGGEPVPGALQCSRRRPEGRGQVAGGQVVVIAGIARGGDRPGERGQGRRVPGTQRDVDRDPGGGCRRAQYRGSGRDRRHAPDQRRPGPVPVGGTGGAGRGRRRPRGAGDRDQCEGGEERDPDRSTRRRTGTRLPHRASIAQPGSRCSARPSGADPSSHSSDPVPPPSSGARSGVSADPTAPARHFRSRSATTASWPRSLGS